MSAVLKNMTTVIDENFVTQFTRAMIENVKLAYKLLSNVNVTMR
ncbi:MAG: hypothetical protein QXU31_04535 [Archaeoglobaceae archaeon]